MKQPELKFGRPCIAWNEAEIFQVAGIYIYETDSGNHGIYLPENNRIKYFDNVTPDLSAPPMNGDEVIGGGHISGQYVGLDRDGRHVISNRNIGLVTCKSICHPQPSKREKLEKLLDRYSCYKSFDTKCLADQILKITEEK